ncbi:hypothetical protein [Bradyrhizobium sp. C9]|uniref:hypothetical protein n=1 Tax=Bradyrhizobium sp. C9 TaxID=142585 RepID=UPI000BE7E3C3|nr:hypothetical protein [Bradyrhizobium sp. C9]PDT76987.1 hypothetical protein CO675_10400 [Bradyrhizobium sp. C9]
MWSTSRFRRLPLELRVALAATLAIFALNVVWAYTQAGWKIDPGAATLCGAILGLAIIGHQARRGFANLIRSQEHQAKLNREARVHAAELEEAAARAQEENDRSLLRAAIRAELVGLLNEAQNYQGVMDTFSQMSGAMAQSNVPAFKQALHFPTFKTPIYDTNISKIGLLGISIAADVVKVMNRAKRPELSIPNEPPLEHKFMKTIYDTASAAYKNWGSDIYHVAMRIRATEEGWRDPGTLVETAAARQANTQAYESPSNPKVEPTAELVHDNPV